METLFSMIMVVVALCAAISSATGKKGGGSKPPAKAGADPAALEARRRHLQELEAKRQQRREMQRVQAARPMAEVSLHDRQPVVSVTRHTDDLFDGSLNYQTTEGEDPCHEPQLAPAVNPCELAPAPVEPRPAEEAGIRLEWTGEAMVKAVVMQEILTRPCNRARR